MVNDKISDSIFNDMESIMKSESHTELFSKKAQTVQPDVKTQAKNVLKDKANKSSISPEEKDQVTAANKIVNTTSTPTPDSEDAKKVYEAKVASAVKTLVKIADFLGEAGLEGSESIADNLISSIVVEAKKKGKGLKKAKKKIEKKLKKKMKKMMDKKLGKETSEDTEETDDTCKECEGIGCEACK